MTVAIVGKYADPSMLDAILEADACEVVIIESSEHAYSTIKRVAPHLVVVCLNFDDAGGFQVLSMLKADSSTSRIPVLTYLVKLAPIAHDDEPVDLERFASRQTNAVSMN